MSTFGLSWQELRSIVPYVSDYRRNPGSRGQIFWETWFIQCIWISYLTFLTKQSDSTTRGKGKYVYFSYFMLCFLLLSLYTHFDSFDAMPALEEAS